MYCLSPGWGAGHPGQLRDGAAERGPEGGEAIAGPGVPPRVTHQ